VANPQADRARAATCWTLVILCTALAIAAVLTAPINNWLKARQDAAKKADADSPPTIVVVPSQPLTPGKPEAIAPGRLYPL